MKWHFESDRPIYIQIVERLKGDIIGEKYQSGEKFPTVRDLAQEAAVNPNTMQKALAELERQGFLESHRTAGRVVAANFEKIHIEREALAQEKIQCFVEQMHQLGYTKEEMIALLKEDDHGIGRD
ncbi:GntR family transcriptional regulator [Bengtsoniella intestinalis]|uniref:GntR family transcriptional regulator n=1 Tax=Bengtsoniella intestinalis TaxID=3073143 RepID=UPI00391EF2DC